MRQNVAGIMSVILFLLFFPAYPCFSETVLHTVNTVEGIQDALTIAENNGKDDFILIEPGTYDVSAAPLNFSSVEDYALRISGISGNPPVLSGSPGSTERVLSISSQGGSNASVDIIRIVISGSRSDSNGGGAHVLATGNVKISECRFDNNRSTAHWMGGGAYVQVTRWSSKAVISYTTFENNFAGYGAGIFVSAPSVDMLGNR